MATLPLPAARETPDQPGQIVAESTAGAGVGAGAGALHAQLAGIVAALTTRFDAASRSLADAVGAIDQVVAALREVAGVFDSGEAASAVDELMAAAHDLRLVKAHADVRAVDIAEIRSSSRALRASAADILRCIQVLDIYGMNVKITSSGLPQFLEFADDMRGKLNAAGIEVRSLDNTLQRLEDSLGEMQRNDALLVDECARVVPQVPDRLVRDAEALKQHQAGLVRLAQSTNAAAQDIRRELGLALGAIQIGDRVRQRLEHVMFGCQLVVDGVAAPAVQRHLMPLLGALAAAAAEEFAADTRALQASLHRLEDSSLQLAALKKLGPDDEAQGFLSLLEGGIADAEGMIAQFGQADRQGAATLEIVLGTVDDVAAKMTAITELRLEVRNMAINIGLSCRNVGQLGKPIMVVANEIRTHSDRLDAIIRSIAQAEAALLGASSHMNREGGTGSTSVDQLSHFLGVIHHCNDRTVAAMGSMDRTAATVPHLLQCALAEFDELMVQVPGIVGMVAHLDPARSDPPADGALDPLQQAFDAMAATYTMIGEREIHNRWLPPGISGILVAQAAPAPDAGDGHDDEDDGLF